MAGKGGGKIHEKHQLILANMLREEGNRFCADCHAKGSYSLESDTALFVLGITDVFAGHNYRVFWSFNYM